MNISNVVPLFERMNVIVDGHFELRSGLHSAKYVNKDILYTDPHATHKVCSLIAYEIYEKRNELGLSLTEEFAVVAPAVGGVALSQATTYCLQDLGMKVIAIYADKTPEGGFVVRRGYENLIPGKKVVVVEDIVTTSGSASDTVKAVKAVGGDVVMVAIVCDRSNGRATAEKMGVPCMSALIQMDVPAYEPDKCPLCAEHVPFNNNLGHSEGTQNPNSNSPRL